MTFWPFKRRRPVQVRVLTRDMTKLRLGEFRADARLVKGAASIMANGHTQLMLEVLRNEHPALMVFPYDTSLDARALHQARCEGYTMAVQNFLAMGQQEALPKTLEPTFEEPEHKAVA